MALERFIRRPGGGAPGFCVPTGVKVKGRGLKTTQGGVACAVFCLLSVYFLNTVDQTQGMQKAHWTTEPQPQHPTTEQSCLLGHQDFGVLGEGSS